MTTGIFENADDAAYLRTAVIVLHDLSQQIDRGTDAALPDLDDDQLTATRAIRDLIVQRFQWATNRLDQLAAAAPARRPMLVDPTDVTTTEGAHGHQFAPVITAPAHATEELSSTHLWMARDGAGGSLYVYRTDVIVLNLRGESMPLWYDRNGRPHHLPHRAGQHLHIPAGVPHMVHTAGDEPVAAARFHAAGRFDEGLRATLTGLDVNDADGYAVLSVDFQQPA